MTKEEFLQKVKKRVLYVYDRKSIVNELSEHIDDSVNDLMEDGMSYEDALELAILQMGNPDDIGKQLNKEHNPIVGYLLLAARVFLILNIIPIVYMLFFGLYYASYQLHPNTVNDAQLIAEINKIVDIPTHRLIIDNIYYSNDGYEDTYVLTYRMRNNYDYTRYFYGKELLYILDQEGNVLDWGRGWTISFVGGKGSSRFEMPKNKIILLQFIDGQVIEIDLEEYGYE